MFWMRRGRHEQAKQIDQKTQSLEEATRLQITETAKIVGKVEALSGRLREAADSFIENSGSGQVNP